MISQNKNFLLFIVDSLNYSHVKSSTVELMPFLNELRRKGISCENMFSQAPYTEAAVMNLYCGQDVLHNGGYMFRFKDAEQTIFDVMKQHGYVTFFNSFQPQCYPSSLRRGIDSIYYNVGYDLGALWSYRLAHFSGLYKSNEISEVDYIILSEIFDDNFAEWLKFVDDVLLDSESVGMIKGNDSLYDAKKVRAEVQTQYDEYRSDKIAYINAIFEQGQKHPLFGIPAYVQNNKIKDRAIPQYVKEEFRSLMKKIKRMDAKLNIKNAKGILHGPMKCMGKLLIHPSKLRFKNFLKSAYLSVNEIIDLDLFQRINEDCDRFKNAPSGRTHIDHFISWTKQRDENSPFFACIHIDDIHNPEVFFTYDTEDKKLIKKERENAEKVLDKIPKGYYGSLTHDLSLSYIDNVIRYLYEKMEEEKLLDNTCIIICADHGFSFAGNPLRDSFVINLYLENYKIPCVITGAGHEGVSVDKLCSSKDIPATICDLAFGKIPACFSGKSVLREDEHFNLLIEYCGGGCPDLKRRDLKIAAFDAQYFVGTLSKLDEEINEKTITEVYDLVGDPLQKDNLVKKGYSFENVALLIEKIRVRKGEIKNTISY